jgi:hypothetical protein
MDNLPPVPPNRPSGRPPRRPPDIVVQVNQPLPRGDGFVDRWLYSLITPRGKRHRMTRPMRKVNSDATSAAAVIVRAAVSRA